MQTIWSSGVGASVGLEAGYTQLASGLGASIGRGFHLRRADQRIMVGCGAAAAIAGAFGAPLAGAFYAFELVIGGYTPASLTPVGVAAVIGYLVAHSFLPLSLGVAVGPFGVIFSHDLAIAALIGVFAALVGIGIMCGVALCENALTSVKVSPPVRLAAGELCRGTAGVDHAAGHVVGTWRAVYFGPCDHAGRNDRDGVRAEIAGLDHLAWQRFPRRAVLRHAVSRRARRAVVRCWIRRGVARARSQSGYLRGDRRRRTVASVVGGPLTMSFIAWKSTGNLWLTSAVLIAVIISTQITRELFGYSFATWRMHLRGETIRSAADVGWIRDLTVRTLMRPDIVTVDSAMPMEEFRAKFPLGAKTQVIAVDAEGRYAGLALVAEAHTPEAGEITHLETILHYRDDVLHPR